MKKPKGLTTAPTPHPLPPEKLRWQCDPATLPFETTADLKPLEGIVGQDRAAKALKMGVELYAPGYNVFVCGLTGTGRMTTIEHLLTSLQPQCQLASDRCYVHNFPQPDQPHLLTMPRGQGSAFRQDMDRSIDFLAARIPQLLEDEKFQRSRNRILERYGAQEKEMLAHFSELLQKEQFALAELPTGTAVVVMVEGQPVPMEKLGDAVQAGKMETSRAKQLQERQEQLQQQFVGIFRKTLQLQRAMNMDLELLEKETASVLVDSVIEEMKEKYPGDKIQKHLEEVRTSLLENLEPFKGTKSEDEETETARRLLKMPNDPFRQYRVNVVLSHDDGDGCPVIVESSPSYVNVFGTVQRSYDMRGVAQADFLDIRGGSLLQADGGYLVMNALDVLLEPGVWKALKRTLIHGRLEIQSASEWFMPLGSSALKPEPIEVNVKIILVGERYLYDMLYANEEDFKKIFKVKADFDSVMERSPESINQYATLLQKLCEEETLTYFTRDAVGAVIEFGSRRAGRQNKLSTRFSEVADLAREADYWCRQEQGNLIERKHVERAIAAHMDRHSLVEDKIQEMIENEILLIDVTGERAGQVNGLSVYDMGAYSFGKPVRITATTSMGRQGIINIERDADLSGKVHNKGVGILAGFLRERFAQEKPLTLDASIGFEQSYSGIDGDSASSTEIYALLSSLSGLPIRQGLAVTGSVNQKGDIQAIGGINQKVEGYFDVCQAKGLDGKQGILLPKENVHDLMLRPDIVDAARKKEFNLYAVSTVDEGIEFLTGVKAGAPLPGDGFEKGTVNFLVDSRLRELAESMERFAADAQKSKRKSRKKRKAKSSKKKPKKTPARTRKTKKTKKKKPRRK
jgi:ATP-dependent Lon protease